MDDKKKNFIQKHLAKAGKMPPMVSEARADGRPQYYDIQRGERVRCVICSANGLEADHPRGSGLFADPANSPVTDRKTGKPDGGVYAICRYHIPDNAVIFDPLSGECRNKAGDETWKEG